MIQYLKVYLFAFASILVLLSSCAKEEPAKKELNISGTIQIDPALKDKSDEKDTIFLIAKPATGGPPVAVIKFLGNHYPYPYHLTMENLMTADSQLDVPLNLSVRVDKDGDAMTKQPGDLLGVYDKNPVPLQADTINITLTDILK